MIKIIQIDNNMFCNYCDTKITKQNLSRHQKSESCVKIQNIIKKNNEEKILLENKINELENKIKIINNELDTTNKVSEEYRKIVEKAATKTTVKNYNHNTNYLNYISSEPLKLSEVKHQVRAIMNCDTVMLDENKFHEHIVDNILKDEHGKDKVLCTDINRKNFTYKDETSGQLICDPELERIREQLRKGADIKSLKKIY